MNWLRWAWLIVLASCAHRAAAPAPLVVVAAGDISGETIGAQAETAALVESLHPAAVLLLGDTQYDQGTPEEYARAFEPTWGRFKDRLAPAPGNHEYKSGAAGYFDYFGARAGPGQRGYYAFDLGGWHFISLNTGHACRDGQCAEGSAQHAWLEADLAATKSKCVVAFFHHPRFSSGLHGPFEAADALWRTLVKHRVELVLNGHEHLYERLAPLDAEGRAVEGGTTEVVVGTGGIGFSAFGAPLPVSVSRQADTFGVLRLSLEADRWVADFVPVPGGRFVDHFSGTCR